MHRGLLNRIFLATWTCWELVALGVPAELFTAINLLGYLFLWAETRIVSRNGVARATSPLLTSRFVYRPWETELHVKAASPPASAGTALGALSPSSPLFDEERPRDQLSPLLTANSGPRSLISPSDSLMQSHSSSRPSSTEFSLFGTHLFDQTPFPMSALSSSSSMDVSGSGRRSHRSLPRLIIEGSPFTRVSTFPLGLVPLGANSAVNLRGVPWRPSVPSPRLRRPTLNITSDSTLDIIEETPFSLPVPAAALNDRVRTAPSVARTRRYSGSARRRGDNKENVPPTPTGEAIVTEDSEGLGLEIEVLQMARGLDRPAVMHPDQEKTNTFKDRVRRTKINGDRIMNDGVDKNSYFKITTFKPLSKKGEVVGKLFDKMHDMLQKELSYAQRYKVFVYISALKTSSRAQAALGT
ncbi:hypothetical protein DFH11DRAFT_1542068 [Phellopilus nigrolimitatus]|nr:hypothetical protein DFH11DRAFT_1542068 [Phellopilus nigrolimitatus]